MQVGRGRRGARRVGLGARARIGFVVLSLGGFIGLPASAQISVSSGGSPSYAVAISVPPGIAGMAPNLSLVYTGGGVNGPVGYGWTLTGVSLITRCPGNALLDGGPVAVKYSATDRLCLDGQRLIQTSAAGAPTAAASAANGALLDANGHPEDGTYTEYRTDKDIYSRIRAYGMANGATANGPRYFKVWTKAGQIYEYGAGPSANAATNALISPYAGTVAAAWAVSRISDTLGNYIDFKYSYNDTPWGSGPSTGAKIGHEWNLAEIQYTGTATSAANNKVIFEYENRPDTPGAAQDRSETYHQGYKNVSIQRLKAVRTYINWSAASLGVTMPGGALVAAPSSAVKVKTLKIGYELGSTTQRSRVISTQECAGPAETACLPKTAFNYAAAPTTEAYAPNANFAASALSTLQLEKADGSMGVLVGDFNGDGRSDIIRWAFDATQNQLYTSNGDGTFTLSGTFNLNAAGNQLFGPNACYYSIVADFNGDGLPDILRYAGTTGAGGAACANPGASVLYLNNGNGQFTPTALSGALAGVALRRTISINSGASCRVGPPTICTTSWSNGFNFYMLDVDGDGKLDIVTSQLPAGTATAINSFPPAINYTGACAQSICTHVYKGDGTGRFTDITPASMQAQTIFTNPTSAYTVGEPAHVADIDGDGLADFVALMDVTKGPTGATSWISHGDGSFTPVAATGVCSYPIDFNGDGRADCLSLSGTALSVADGSLSPPNVANFNLTGPGQELYGSTLGVVPADLNNDGRTDLIRWEDDPTKNVVYLSNGDGTFRTSTLFNLNTAAYALKKSDGSRDFLTADFTGNGNVEILRTVSAITAGNVATTNQLFVKASNVPPEQLSSMTSPNGLSSTLTYVTLPNSSSGALGARYQSAAALGVATSYPKINLTPPMWVIATVENASGVGSTTTKDEYAYGGLRASLDGSGLLGFLQVSEQHSAPDGSALTTVTSYLQDSPYIGVAGSTKTLDGALNQPNAPMISRTTNSYCDTTSSVAAAVISAGGVPPTPCATASLVQRPYLYQSLEEGWDIDANRSALPTVTTTNAFNTTGDATQISVVTQGTSAGVAQTVTKVTNNTFLANNTAGDAWILGRLQSSTQTNTVPAILGSIATQAGSSPTATATQGTGPTSPPTPTSTHASINAILPVILQILLSD